MKRLLARGSAPEPAERAVLRPDGALRRPVTIWVVRDGDDLFVRSWRGRTGAWFRGAQDSREGHISAGGVDKDVRFVEADDSVNDAIDAAYRTKYRRYSDSYVPPMISPEARATTIELVPRSTHPTATPRQIRPGLCALFSEEMRRRVLATSLMRRRASRR